MGDMMHPVGSVLAGYAARFEGIEHRLDMVEGCLYGIEVPEWPECVRAVYNEGIEDREQMRARLVVVEEALRLMTAAMESSCMADWPGVLQRFHREWGGALRVVRERVERLEMREGD